MRRGECALVMTTYFLSHFRSVTGVGDERLPVWGCWEPREAIWGGWAVVSVGGEFETVVGAGNGLIVGQVEGV